MSSHLVFDVLPDISIMLRWPNETVYTGQPLVANRAATWTWLTTASKMGAQRFFGQLSFVPNLNHFPFDSQTLEFSFIHPAWNSSQLVFEPLMNETFISPLLRLVNWQYSNSSVSAVTKEFISPTANFSQVTLQIYVQRTIPYGIQTLLSPSFALIMVFVSFWLPIKENFTRISMATAALVSEVFYHVNLRSSALLNLSTS